MSDMRARAVEILLVEDNPGDVRLIQEALDGGKLRNNPHVVSDGQAAIDFLHRRGKFGDAPRPDLILLDLNLPRRNGREVLESIKAHDDLKRIPVVILTTSKEEEDIVRAYNLSANCCVTKPVEFEQFMKVIRMIEEFWLTIVTLPH
jgi:two-component system, chemotaxis family, response regulator Rcp1